MTCFYQVSSEFLVFHGVISEYWQRNGLSGFEQNQFLIISKLFLLSAEFLISFSWNDWAIIFLTCIFFFKYIMWQFFLNIFDAVSYIMKWRINQSFISAQIYLAWRSRWCVEEKSWHSLYSMHFHVRKGPVVLFCYCFGSNITLLIK